MGLGVLVLAAVALAVNEFRPVGPVPASQTLGSTANGGGDAAPVPWPANAQAALGGEEHGALISSPNAQAKPIASVAKVMTALVALQAKPLQADQQGPSIPIGPEEVTEYQQEKGNGESVVPVQAGEQLTEFQALQGLLIPSGNNIAALLARWASGSVAAHVQKMNDEARQLGMTHTTFVDVSGLDEKTISVPADLVRMGQAALDQPVIAQIVQEAQATLPVAGKVINVNYVLGQEGIFGIKTGNITAGGAIYLFAASIPVGGAKMNVVGAVQGLTTLDNAFNAAKALLRAGQTALRLVHVVSKDQTVGRYAAPWGSVSDVVATQDLDVLVWSGTVIRTTLRARAVDPPLSPRTGVGTLHVTAGDATFDLPVANATQMTPAGRLARLTRVTW